MKSNSSKYKEPQKVQKVVHKNNNLLTFLKGQGFKRLNNLNNLSNLSNLYEENRRDLLDSLRKKQPFRVAKGKSKWVQYEEFNSDYNLREILNSEIVIEFDSEDQNLTWMAINETAINLYKTGISFEIWDHEGKSPHLHIHDLPTSNLEPSKRALFKKMFIRKYVPIKYLSHVDISLTGIHLIAIEWAEHWKGRYDVKKLLSKFNSEEAT